MSCPNLLRPEPHEQVVRWTDRQPVGEVFITAITLADAQIAAICRSHGATVATRNDDDFPTSESTS